MSDGGIIFIRFGDFRSYWTDRYRIHSADTVFQSKVCRKMEISDLDFSCAAAAYSFSWHLAAETSLHVPTPDLERVLEVVDEFIVDIKDMDEGVYASYTGQSQGPVRDNLHILSEAVAPQRVKIRIPRIPSYNTDDHIRNSLEQLREMGFTQAEVFDYLLKI